MKKIILWLMIFVATIAIVTIATDAPSKVYEHGEKNASSKVYEPREYEERKGILYEKGTNKKLNGIAKEYYESGELKREYNFKDGIPNGIATIYHKSGALLVEVNFKDGEENGIAKIYRESGALMFEENFKDGKRNGIKKEYYEPGVLMTESNYVDGKRNGIAKFYYKSGALLAEVTTKDDKAISGILYNEDGTKDSEMTNADFKKLGLSY